ncbi:MAG: hypothetical protein QM739_06110 [Propionivibrio sp.]
MFDGVAQFFQLFERVAAFGGGAEDLFDDQGAGDAAPSVGVRGVFEGDIVVDHDHGVVEFEHFGGHFELHHVAGVVLDDEQDASTAVDRFRGVEHLVGIRRGENLARTGGVQHAFSDKADVQRFVPRAATRNQGDFPRLHLPPSHILPLRSQYHRLRMRQRKTVQRLITNRIYLIHESFHLFPRSERQYRPADHSPGPVAGTAEHVNSAGQLVSVVILAGRNTGPLISAATKQRK